MTAEESKKLMLDAWRECIEIYSNPEKNILFECRYCPLCKVTRIISFRCPSEILQKTLSLKRCIPCPLSDGDIKIGSSGCGRFYLLKKGMSVWRNYPFRKSKYTELIVKFLKHYLPILEKLPASQFTLEGWGYFDGLDRNWGWGK